MKVLKEIRINGQENLGRRVVGMVIILVEINSDTYLDPPANISSCSSLFVINAQSSSFLPSFLISYKIFPSGSQ